MDDGNLLKLSEANNVDCTDDTGELSEASQDSKSSDKSDLLKDIVLFSGKKDEHYYKLLARASPHVPRRIQEKLETLNIRLTHHVPRSHKIDKCLVEPPNSQNRRKLKSLGVRFTKGGYLPEDDAIIHRNWKNFCEKYGFEDPGPFLRYHVNDEVYLPQTQRIKFVQYLGNGLPDRSLRNIYARFHELYQPFRKGCFRREEDNLIKLYYAKGIDKAKVSTLSKILQRKKHSIWARLQKLKLRDEGPIKWNMTKAGNIVKHLMDITGTSRLRDLKKIEFSRRIWKKVGEKCCLGPVVVEKFWQKKLSTQLFIPRPIYLNATRIHLIERLSRDEVKVWREIRWTDIAEEDFRGVSPHFLKAVFKKLLRICYPDANLSTLKTNIEDTVKDLKVRHIEVIKKMDDYFLKKLRLNSQRRLEEVKRRFSTQQ